MPAFPNQVKKDVWSVIIKEKIRLNTTHPYSVVIVDSGGEYGICKVSYSGALILSHRRGREAEDQARFLGEVLVTLPQKITVLDIYMSSTFCMRCLSGDFGPLFEITGWAKKWREDGWVKANGAKVSAYIRRMVDIVEKLINQGVVLNLHKVTKSDHHIEGLKEAHLLTQKKI